ncbi:MAG TPA: hypothetical protein VFX33_08355 [Actinomycetales bacterium]|nr:hypothetical protein [Actinomycetales bacterium]
MLAVDHGHDLTVGVLVGLGPTNGEQDAAGLELDVGQRERGQLGAPHRGGEAEQDDRGIAGTQGGRAVDVLDDLADLPGAQRSGLAAGSGADDPAQTSADLAVHPVAVRDGARRRGRWCRPRDRRPPVP